MKEVLDGIRAAVGAENCARSCSRDGCRVYLQGVPRGRVVVDVDKAFEAHGGEGKRCDFIVFLPGADGKLIAAPIELKSGRFDVSDALEQLQKGAEFAEQFAPGASETVCRPILIHGKSIRPKARKALERSKIRFGGLALTVKTKRCGQPGNLMNALEM